MKGWIKVHGANKTWQDKYLRAQDVYAIEEYTEGEEEGFKPFSCTLINDCYYVSESVDEVLALIEKAKNGEEETTPVAVIETDKLLAWLEKQKKEAKSKNRTALTDKAEGFHAGSLFSISEVIRHVERETYLVEKPADREEEE